MGGEQGCSWVGGRAAWCYWEMACRDVDVQPAACQPCLLNQSAHSTPLTEPLLFSIQELGWSAEESFVSPPAVGPDSTVRLLAVADLGQAEADGCVLG